MMLTILTPTLNCRFTIEKTIKSVIELKKICNFKIEHIIGDSYSTDGTYEILTKYAKSNDHIKLFSVKENIPKTLNLLLTYSSGIYTTVLNGDDYLLPVSFYKSLITIIENKSIDLICSDMLILNSREEIIGERVSIIKELKNYMSINHQALIVKSNLLKNCKFIDAYPFNYDYVWIWSLLNLQESIPINIAKYNEKCAVMRTGGISSKREMEAAVEILKFKFKNKHILNAIKNFVTFITKRIIKSLLPHFILHIVINPYRKFKKSGDIYYEK